MHRTRPGDPNVTYHRIAISKSLGERRFARCPCGYVGPVVDTVHEANRDGRGHLNKMSRE